MEFKDRKMRADKPYHGELYAQRTTVNPSLPTERLKWSLTLSPFPNYLYCSQSTLYGFEGVGEGETFQSYLT